MIIQPFARKAAAILVVLSSTVGIYAQQDIPIAVGDTLTATYDANTPLEFPLPITNVPLLVVASSEVFSPALTWLSSGGNSFTIIGTGESQIFVPPSTGTQSVAVSGVRFPTPPGDFTLSVIEVPMTPITADAPTEGILGEDGQAVYFIHEGEAGDLLTVRTESGGPALELRLYSTSVAADTTNYGGANGLDSEIIGYPAYSTGITYLEVRPAFPGETGSFRVTLTTESVSTLTSEPQTIRLDEYQSSVAGVTFEGQAGVPVTINFPDLSSDVLFVTEATQNGVSVHTPAGFDVPTTIVITPPADGLVIVRFFTSLIDSRAQFEVALAQ